MGKGDRKSKKGKISKNSFGVKRQKKQKNNFIKPSNLKKWSIEKIYYECGKFDFTTTITFKKDSESYNLFGKTIVGEVYFSMKERRLLRINFNSGIKNETSGYVRYTSHIKEKLDEEKVEILSSKGFKNTDILDITTLNYFSNPTYLDKIRKKLRTPLEVKVPKISNLNALKMTYNLFKIRINTKDYLTDYEKNNMMSIQKVLNIKETDETYIFNKIVKERDAEFNFLYENKLIELDKIKKLSDKTLGKRLEYSKDIVKNEFLKGGINLEKNEELIKYRGLYSELIQIGMNYLDEIILYDTFPKVVLDFKGYMHVVFRHSNLCNIGSKNSKKSRIPYELNEIKRLIKSCIYLLKNEISTHFFKHPNKRFSKFGDQLIRFNNDYYEIHINTKGLIETFYNRGKNYA